MRVLVACECSGVVREAFRRRGHDAWSCDLSPAEDSNAHHYVCDTLSLLGPMGRTHRGTSPVFADGFEWDLMIAHPPCTHLAVSGAHRFKEKRADGRQQAALEFVRALLAAPIPRIALENPVSIISSAIRKPDQIIQPYEFGHSASKATCLWLKGLPPLRPTRFIEPRYVCCGRALPDGVGKYGCPNCEGKNAAKPRWANQTDSGQNRLAPSETRAADRARTYPGIADAMAAQWG